MIKAARVIVIIGFLWCSFLSAGAFANKVMSFNIRTEHANDPGELAWENRKQRVVSVIKSSGVTLVGLQEATDNQRQFILKELGGNWHAVEGTPLLYDRRYYSLTDVGKFELIEDKWERRFAYWVKLTAPSVQLPALQEQREGSGVKESDSLKKQWVFITTHWGVDSDAQMGSAKIMANQVASISNQWDLPVLLVGDFNIVPNSKPYKLLHSRTPLRSVFEGKTFTAFENEARVQLDYVWAYKMPEMKCTSNDFSVFPYPASDHYAVVCEFVNY